jgi:radical SAM superfamily enzyme YgiQ (UPF0313 family)
VHPALGFTSIATALRNAGHEVSFLDLNTVSYPFKKLAFNPAFMSGYPIQWQGIEDHLKTVRADIFFLTASFTRYISETSKVAALIKRFCPGACVVAGGVHATFLPRELLNDCPDIDCVVRGEGEHIALALCKARAEKAPFEGIQAITWRRSDGTVVSSEGLGFIQDLNTLAFPQRDLWPVKEYRLIWKHLFEGRDPLGLIMTSRGCVGRCIFCASGKPELKINTLRFRNFASVEEELSYLIKDFNISTVDVIDDCLTLNRELLPKLCGFLKTKKLPWVCKSRIDMLKPETISLLKGSGCARVFVGIESADDNVLEEMGKRIRFDLIKKVVADLFAAGLDFSASFTIGHPKETRESIARTTEFASHLARRGKRVGVYLITPYPGTKLFDVAKEKHWITSFDWREYDQTAHSKAIYAPGGWTPKELQNAYKEAWKKVYAAHVMSMARNPFLLFKKLAKISFAQKWVILYNGIRNVLRRLTGNHIITL